MDPPKWAKAALLVHDTSFIPFKVLYPCSISFSGAEDKPSHGKCPEERSHHLPSAGEEAALSLNPFTSTSGFSPFLLGKEERSHLASPQTLLSSPASPLPGQVPPGLKKKIWEICLLSVLLGLPLRSEGLSAAAAGQKNKQHRGANLLAKSLTHHKVKHWTWTQDGKKQPNWRVRHFVQKKF